MSERGGWRKWVAVCALLLLLLVAAPPAAPRLTPASSGLGVTVQLTSTAISSKDSRITLWHNTSSSNQSVPVLYSVNIAPYTAAGGSAVVFTISAGTMEVVANISQGTVAFVNATVGAQVTVNPVFSGASVSIKVLQLLTSVGNPVNVGTYTVFVNETQNVAVSYLTPGTWVQNALNYTLPYGFSAPAGYYLNTTQVLLPYPPAVGVNYSSVQVLNATAYQVGYSGVYASNQSLKPGASLTFTGLLQPNPISSGPAAIISMGPAKQQSNLYGLLNVYVSFANWTNYESLPYEGIYVLRLSFAYTISPSSVVLRADGKVVPSTEFSVQQSSLVLPPLTLLLGVGTTEQFQVNFSSELAPPSGSLVGGEAAFYFGPIPVTVLDLVLSAILLTLCIFDLYLVGWRTGRIRHVNIRNAAVDTALIEAGLIALLIIVQFAPGG